MALFMAITPPGSWQGQAAGNRRKLGEGAAGGGACHPAADTFLYTAAG
jgi:hypothetical protein